MGWRCSVFSTITVSGPKPIDFGDNEVETWYRVAVLSIGGVLGVNARFWLGVAINRFTSAQFPWATFTINVSGSFAIGLCTAVLARWLPHPHARLLIVVGFLGGYTTFSSYSMESLALWERGERGLCVAYLVGSVVAGFVAVVLGTMLGRANMRPDAAAAPSAPFSVVAQPPEDRPASVPPPR
jgi:fluoride exporter